MAPHVKHHGFGHFFLGLILFFLAVVVFGGWTEGPLTSGLKTLTKVYQLMAGIFVGQDFGASADFASSVLGIVIIFVVNLVIFYFLSTAILLFYNLLFGRH